MGQKFLEYSYLDGDFFAYAARGTKSLYRRKPHLSNTSYHAFNRRDDQAPVFVDDVDRATFVGIMQRLLRPDDYRDERGRATTSQDGLVKLLGYCLLESHYHLILHQDEPYAIAAFMRSLMSAYTRRFNRRHGRKGPLFDERYQARPIESVAHMKTAIAYVHANPASPLDYRWSGHGFFMDRAIRDDNAWIEAAEGLRVYGSRAEYSEWFLRAVEARKRRMQNRQTKPARSRHR